MSAPDDLGDVRERREAMLVAATVLEAALAAPAFVERWRDDLGEALSAFSTTLAAHISETEASDGLLKKVCEDAPRLSNQIDRLFAEHATLTSVTGGLMDRLEHVPAERTQSETDEIREEALQLLALIVRHRQRGSDLVYEAYNVDVGGPG